MAISLNDRIKNKVLGRMEDLGGDTYYLLVEAFNNNTSLSDRVRIDFGTPVDGEINIKNSVDLAVGKVVVNKLRLYRRNPGTGVQEYYAEIILQGSEILDFSGTSDGGIYRINAFEVSL